MLRLIFAIPILLLPFALHVPTNIGVAGMNISNLLLILVVCALFLGDRDPPHLARPGFLRAPLVLLFVALILAFVSAEWTDVSHIGDDLAVLKNALFFPLFYFVYRRCGQDLAGTRVLIVLVLATATAAGAMAVYQGIQFGVGQYNPMERATGPFGDMHMANRAGVFFAMFLPMLAAVALQFRQRKLARWAAIGGSAILVVAILFTYSRQSYLIALFAITILLLWRSVPAALLTAVLLAVVAASLLPPSVMQRVQETQQVDASGSVQFDLSTTSRFEIWEGTADMLQDHPWGVGLDRFNQHIGEYTNHPGMDAHNGFILMLAECGPLGLLAMLWVFWRLWLMARWLRRSAGPSRPEAYTLAWGFTLTVVSMGLSNLYGSPFLNGLVMADFWILCGLMERYGAIKAHAASVVAAYSKPQVRPAPSVGPRFPLTGRVLPGHALYGKGQH